MVRKTLPTRRTVLGAIAAAAGLAPLAIPAASKAAHGRESMRALRGSLPGAALRARMADPVRAP